MMNKLPLTYSRIGSNYEHGKIRAVSSETKDGGLHVLLVASQVNESDQL